MGVGLEVPSPLRGDEEFLFKKMVMNAVLGEKSPAYVGMEVAPRPTLSLCQPYSKVRIFFLTIEINSNKRSSTDDESMHVEI